MTKPELTPEQFKEFHRVMEDEYAIEYADIDDEMIESGRNIFAAGLAAGQQGNAVSQPVVNEVIISGVQALIDSLLPNFEYVGVSLRVSQEDHAAIRSAIAGASTALHLLKARLNPPPAAPRAHDVVDLDRDFLAAINEAVGRNTWMPPEYVSNDWHTDVLRFLEYGPQVFSNAVPSAPLDEERVIELAKEAGFAWHESTGLYKPNNHTHLPINDELLRFAALIARELRGAP